MSTTVIFDSTGTVVVPFASNTTTVTGLTTAVRLSDPTATPETQPTETTEAPAEVPATAETSEPDEPEPDVEDDEAEGETEAGQGDEED